MSPNRAIGLAVRQARSIGTSRPWLEPAVRRDCIDERSRPSERRVDAHHVDAACHRDQHVVSRQLGHLSGVPSAIALPFQHHRPSRFRCGSEIDAEHSHVDILARADHVADGEARPFARPADRARTSAICLTRGPPDQARLPEEGARSCAQLSRRDLIARRARHLLLQGKGLW